MFLSELTFPVADLDGIGPSSVKSLQQLGIINIAGLLLHYPIRYEDRKTPVPLASSSSIRPAVTIATVRAHDQFRWKKGLALKVIIEDDTAIASMLCYGRNFLENKLPVGHKIRIAGPFEANQFGDIQSSSFVFENAAIPESQSREFGMILPYYALAGRLTQPLLRKAINQSIQKYTRSLKNEIPEMLMRRKKFFSKKNSIQAIHFPESLEDAARARRTLIFEELFHLQITVTQRQIAARQLNPYSRPWDEALPKKLRASLPFQLTDDQNRTLDDIRQDMSNAGTMLRLVQGEVGSGKTLVAFIACLGVIGMHRQAAFMAPTELLARQHADNAARLLNPLGVRTALLTGDLTTSERSPVLKALQAGNIDLLIGTHALFSADVSFKDLAMVVIDEQHRFGVDQRRSLAEKGQKPDILALSATPIPRTLTLTAFGDMDFSTIKTMPVGRLPVETHLAKIGNEAKVYGFVQRELNKGHQAYFVYPLIEESEKIDLKNAQQMFDILQNTIFPKFHGALIHSRIDEDEKRRIMTEFREGKIRYIVATSVVEVGVDVANATCMVIEHAQRFGLSSLHQLRGRVGRGQHQSYCFLVYDEQLTEDGKKRLMTMHSTNDGFTLAEEDLKIRGPGDMAGIRQSGFLKMTIADPVRDIDVLLDARNEAQQLLTSDKNLEQPDNKNLKSLLSTHPPFDEILLRTL